MESITEEAFIVTTRSFIIGASFEDFNLKPSSYVVRPSFRGSLASQPFTVAASSFTIATTFAFIVTWQPSTQE